MYDISGIKYSSTVQVQYTLGTGRKSKYALFSFTVKRAHFFHF